MHGDEFIEVKREEYATPGKTRLRKGRQIVFRNTEAMKFGEIERSRAFFL